MFLERGRGIERLRQGNRQQDDARQPGPVRPYVRSELTHRGIMPRYDQLEWAAQTEDYQEGKRKGDERIGVILRGQAEQDQASGGAAARAAMVA